MRDIAVRGQAVFESQRQFYELSNVYYRGVKETEEREKRCAEIKQSARALETKTDSRIRSAAVMRTDLAVLKRDPLLQFHSCVLSLAYMSTSLETVELKITTDSSMNEFLDG